MWPHASDHDFELVAWVDLGGSGGPGSTAQVPMLACPHLADALVHEVMRPGARAQSARSQAHCSQHSVGCSGRASKGRRSQAMQSCCCMGGLPSRGAWTSSRRLPAVSPSLLVRSLHSSPDAEDLRRLPSLAATQPHTHVISRCMTHLLVCTIQGLLGSRRPDRVPVGCTSSQPRTAACMQWQSQAALVLASVRKKRPDIYASQLVINTTSALVTKALSASKAVACVSLQHACSGTTPGGRCAGGLEGAGAA